MQIRWRHESQKWWSAERRIKRWDNGVKNHVVKERKRDVWWCVMIWCDRVVKKDDEVLRDISWTKWWYESQMMPAAAETLECCKSATAVTAMRSGAAEEDTSSKSWSKTASRKIIKEGATKVNFRGQKARICKSRRCKEYQRFNEREQISPKPVSQPLFKRKYQQKWEQQRNPRL